MKIVYNNEDIEMKHLTVIKLIILKEWWNGSFGQTLNTGYFFQTRWYRKKLDEGCETTLK